MEEEEALAGGMMYEAVDATATTEEVEGQGRGEAHGEAEDDGMAADAVEEPATDAEAAMEEAAEVEKAESATPTAAARTPW